MTVARRLAAIEVELDPTQRVNRLFAEAHAYDGFGDYVQATVLAGPIEMPLDRLVRETIESIRGQRPRPADVDAEVRAGIRGVVFRFYLALRIVEVTEAAIDREGLIFAALSAYAVLAMESERWRADSPIGVNGVRDLFMARVGELHALQDARAQVEGRYLGGHSPLFAASVRRWQDQFRQTEQMAHLVIRLAELDGYPIQGDIPLVPEGRTERCVLDLTEPARAKALDTLGDGHGAVAGLRAWLG